MYRYLTGNDIIRASDEWCFRDNTINGTWKRPNMSVGLPYKRYMDYYIFRRSTQTTKGNKIIGV